MGQYDILNYFVPDHMFVNKNLLILLLIFVIHISFLLCGLVSLGCICFSSRSSLCCCSFYFVRFVFFSLSHYLILFFYHFIMFFYLFFFSFLIIRFYFVLIYFIHSLSNFGVLNIILYIFHFCIISLCLVRLFHTHFYFVLYFFVA